ncbi:MAG: type II secretion system secretin GspD [Sulfurovum sp.]
MKLIKIVLSILILSVVLNAKEEMVDVNFRNLSVKDFVEMVSKITQRNILINAPLKGKINFVSQTPIKKSSLFSLANSILGDKGLTIVDKGEYYKIVKSNTAAGEGLDVSSTIKGDTMITVLFPLKNLNSAVLRAKIKPLLHKSAKVIAFKQNNVLAITATPSTLKAISKVIKAVEKNSDNKSVVVKLKNSSVKDIFPNAQNIAKKIFPQTIENQKIVLLKDASTNSIILVGNGKNIKRMIKYIKQLDTEGESIEQKMYVIRLKNSNVEEMEKIMSKLIAQMNNVAIKKPKKGAKAPSKAMVVSDVERNALILLATAEQMKNIRATVRKIDIPKVQVYVKAKIIEIDNNLAKQVGLKYGIEGGSITSNGLFSLGANFGASALSMSPELLGFLNTQTTNYDANGNAITTNSRPFTFSSDVDKLFALGASLDLLQQNGAAHILSEPSILCTNNKEASIYVGQTISIMTKAQQSATGGSNVLNNYSREDIGITLKVKPRLSSNNQVTLEIETQIEDVLPGSGATADRPTTTKRKIITNVIVNNGETIILGGLIKKSGGSGVSKVPLLGDIPILGELLFTHKSTVNSSENVVIYLTPYIVRKSGDLQKLKSILTELDKVQERYNTLVHGALSKQSSSKKINPASRRIRQPRKSNLSILDEGY